MNLLLDNLSLEKNQLMSQLREMAIGLTDTEEEVMECLLNGETDYHKLAEKLGLDYGYIKNMASRIKREITTAIKFDDKENLINALCKISTNDNGR